MIVSCPWICGGSYRNDIVNKYYIGKNNFIFIDKDESGLSLEELESELRKLNKKDAVFFADFFIDKNKRVYSIEDIFPRIAEVSNAPIYDNDDTGVWNNRRKTK